jgi:SAM-dependent methyltransferase
MRSANILDPIQPELDQTVFDGITPRKRHIDFIKRLYYRALDKELGVPPSAISEWADLYLTGSLTTYQYSEVSDADISVFPNYEEIWERLGLEPDQARKELVSLSIAHIDGTFLPGTTHPMQFFVVPYQTFPQDKFKPGERSGYSLLERQWFVEPEKDRAHDIQTEMPDIWVKAVDMADKMNDMLDHDPERAREMWHLLHKKRTLEQNAGEGDFSEGNIIYKYMLNHGIFDRLRTELGEYIAASKLAIPNPFTQGLPPDLPAIGSTWTLANPYDAKIPRFTVQIIDADDDEIWLKNLDSGEEDSITTKLWQTWKGNGRVWERKDDFGEPDDATVNEMWPDFLPFGEEEQDYYRNASIYEPLDPQQFKELFSFGYNPQDDTFVKGNTHYDCLKKMIGDNYEQWRGPDWERTVMAMQPVFGWVYSDYDAVFPTWTVQFVSDLFDKYQGDHQDAAIQALQREYPDAKFELATEEDYSTGLQQERRERGKASATDHLWDDRVTTKVIYDFDNDRIILGTQADKLKLPASRIIGEYKDEAVTLYDADRQWINPMYFHRLWSFSFPNRPLNDVYFKRGEDTIKLKTLPRNEKKGMAERTGDPELDAAIDRFMKEEYRYLCGGEKDPENAVDYRNPEDSYGECYEVSDFFANWLYQNYPDMDAYLPEDETAMEGMPWTEEGRDPHPHDFGYTDRPGSDIFGYPDDSVKDEDEQHHVVIVKRPSGTYTIDWTASQYGYTEFPMIQRLDQGQWQRQWKSGASADFVDFFDQASRGQHAPQLSLDPTFDNPQHQQFHDTYKQYAGNFDAHIETSIPGYREHQVKKGAALADRFQQWSVLDIGGSEGSWNKAVSQIGGNETVNLEPNAAMIDQFHRNPVQNAKLIPHAFGESFEHGGTQYPKFEPDRTYDVVNESMTFQFVSPDRPGQVAEVLRLLTPGGLFLTDEKVITEDWMLNERKKDAWKSQFYTPEQLQEKQQIVNVQDESSAVGMVSNMVHQKDLEATLQQYFQTVTQYWSSGNFVGYACSDDANIVNQFIGAYNGSEEIS